jgi:CRP/FNR family cyclic AMP-dependent transcriptional regulator
MEVHDFTIGLGFVGGILYITSHYMKTMVPLRLCEIASNALFVIYGLLYPSWPTLALYAILVPLNSLRLHEMLQLIKKVKAASQDDLSMDWLKPFMHKRSYGKGSVLFQKGDHADKMFYILNGVCRVKELNLQLKSGQMVGELGFLTPDHQRTQTVECVEEVEMLTITYDKVRELYFQNPSFGFYFLRLASERLLENVDRMERSMEEREQPPVAPAIATITPSPNT